MCCIKCEDTSTLPLMICTNICASGEQSFTIVLWYVWLALCLHYPDTANNITPLKCFYCICIFQQPSYLWMKIILDTNTLSYFCVKTNKKIMEKTLLTSDQLSPAPGCSACTDRFILEAYTRCMLLSRVIRKYSNEHITAVKMLIMFKSVQTAQCINQLK